MRQTVERDISCSFQNCLDIENRAKKYPCFNKLPFYLVDFRFLGPLDSKRFKNRLLAMAELMTIKTYHVWF
jgi:hypothetical protein